MVSKIEGLAEQFDRNNFPEVAGLLKTTAQKARELGAPESFSENGKRAEELDLEVEWQNQATNLASLFAGELGLTQEEYITSLPKFEPQPDNWKGRFDIPVIVETRVPLKRMVKLAGIFADFGVASIQDWQEGKSKTPKAPYATWLNDGISNLNKSVDTVRKSLKSDERGATVYDGVALYLKNPEILGNHYLDLPGSRVGSGRAPFLLRWGGQPRLRRSLVGDANPRYGSLVAGKL